MMCTITEIGETPQMQSKGSRPERHARASWEKQVKIQFRTRWDDVQEDSKHLW